MIHTFWLAQLAALPAADLTQAGKLVTWTEPITTASGQIEVHEIKGEVWNEAIQAVLDQSNSVHLPKRDQPYFLDGPIILKSGQKLTADADSLIHLIPGTNSCMVRNEHVIGFSDPTQSAFWPNRTYGALKNLLELGPKSVTYKHHPDEPATWTELFTPDLDWTVRHLNVTGVRSGAVGGLPH